MSLRTKTAIEPCALFEQGRWRSTLVHHALQQAEQSQQASDWINYLDICQSIKGITLEEWLHVAKRCNALTASSPKLLLRLLYLMQTQDIIENMDESKRCLLFSETIPASTHSLLDVFSDIRSSGYLGSRLPHYPGLLARAKDYERLAGLRNCWLNPTTKKASLLASKVIPFHEIARQLPSAGGARADTPGPIQVAVVGNSPVIFNREQGSAIDSADVVIRFNNASIADSTRQHTGLRTDIWVMSPSTSPDKCPLDASTVIVSGLHSLTRPSFYWKKLAGLDKSLSQFPAYVWYRLVEQFNAPPSAGTLIIASLEAVLEHTDIRCYGFSTNQTDLEKYSNHHADLKPRSDRHNWQAEINWLAERPVKGEAFIVTRQ